MTAAAAGLAGLAVALWFPPGRVVVALRLADRSASGPATVVRSRGWGPSIDRVVSSRGGRWSAAVPAAVGLGVAPWVVDSPVSALLLVTSTAVLAHVVATVRSSRRRAIADDLAVRVAAGVELLAAELRTGAPPATALRGTLDDLPELEAVVAVAERAGDVAAALGVVAGVPGGRGLAAVAAAWRVAERAGAPVADVLDRVVDAARAERDVAREVRAEGASARATARLLAVLPLLGLGLGSGLGGDPVHVLLGTLPGAVCLAAGSALALGGLAWVERIGASADGFRS